MSLDNSLHVSAVRIFCTDHERAHAFYAGELGLVVETLDRDAHYSIFDTGEAKLLLEEVTEGEPEAAALVGRFVGVSLAVRDVYGVYVRMRARGVRFTGPPAEHAWAGTLAHLIDPDGNIVTLVE